MNNNFANNDTQYLASLAVFRELYDSEKDIYGIISEFINSLILTHKKHNFSLTEITELLNHEFEFQIPSAVVKAALKRLKYLKINNRTYFVDKLPQINNKVQEKRNKIIIDNNLILEKLFKYIEEETKTSLNDSDKKLIVNSLSSFLLYDSSNTKYSETISAYLIQNKENGEFVEQIERIKEGVVIYSGLKYNTDLNDFGALKQNLTIFLETEILFHLIGYNGDLYRKIAIDFFSYVKEINNKSKKYKIYLRYFEQTKTEITNFFLTAESIVKGDRSYSPSKTAMTSIINGCQTPSDVVEKRTAFFEYIKKYNILEDTNKGYFSKENEQYNLFSTEIKSKLTKIFDVEDVTQYTQLINNVNILRKGNNSNDFFNIGVVLLTGNSLTLKISWHPIVKEDCKVPLSTDISFLINKFWFKLNKGFGNVKKPVSFNVISKAQIILSSSLNNSIALKYDELNSKLQGGLLTKEEAIASIVALRKQVRKPEDIQADEIKSVLETISEDSIYKYIQEKDYLKIENEKKLKENEELQKELNDYKQRFSEVANKQKKIEEELILFKLESNQLLLNEKKRTKKKLEDNKKFCDLSVSKQMTKYKWRFFIFFILYYAITYFLIWKLSWDVLEKWTWIINATLPFLLSLVYILFYEKTFNPINFLTKKRDYYIETIYRKYSFDLNELEEIQSEIKLLEDRLSEK